MSQIRRALVKPASWFGVYPAALVLAIVLPFGAIPPLINTPFGSLSDEKLVLLIVLAAWLAQGHRALPDQREWRALLPTLALLGVSLASASLAGDYADEAVHFAGRLLAAAFALLVAIRLASAPTSQQTGVQANELARQRTSALASESSCHTSSQRAAESASQRSSESASQRTHQRASEQARLSGLLWAVVIGGGASALLGLGEALRWPVLEPVLGLFKAAPTRVGGELRVSASFQYATIAAMYFEMVAPLAIVLAATSRRAWVQMAGAVIAVVCTANVVLSLTRAGLLTLAVVYAALLAFALTRRAWQRLMVPTLAAASVLVGGTTLLLLRDPVFDLRLVTESDTDWYGAEYSAPAVLDVQPNQTALVALDVRNAGRITWTNSGNHPFALGYRWLNADGSGVLELPPAQVALTSDVEPGRVIHLQAIVQVPNLPAGDYRLDWGMLQRDVLQFYERGWADAETAIRVVGPPHQGELPPIAPRDDGEAPWVVGRLDLWGAALRLAATHPLLGVGPDHFRHLYGAELGLEAWDERVQANNMYLEVLADLGVAGLLGFIWLVAAPIRCLVQTVKARTSTSTTDPSARYRAIGIALALAAFLLHGLLDTFLVFTPTAMLFWMLLGAAQARADLRRLRR